MTPPDNPRPDPAEQRLIDYLVELRDDPPETDKALVRRVSRSARWQAAVRDPLQVIGHLTGAVLDGIAGLFGPSRRSGR